jgi:hypothetical protein
MWRWTVAHDPSLFLQRGPGIFRIYASPRDNFPINAIQIYVDGTVKYETPDDFYQHACKFLMGRTASPSKRGRSGSLQRLIQPDILHKFNQSYGAYLCSSEWIDWKQFCPCCGQRRNQFEICGDANLFGWSG